MESIRFTGLASGMDTQSIVDAMMKSERLPLDKLNQQKQILEWQRDDFRNMNKVLKDFDTFLFDNIYRQSKMLKKTTTTSNNELVTAIASAEAGNVSYKIENVMLATAARRQSTVKDSDGNIIANGGVSKTSQKIDPTKSLWSQKDNFANSFTWGKTDLISEQFKVSEGGGQEFQLKRGAISDYPTHITVSGHADPFEVRTRPITAGDALQPNEVFLDESTGRMKFGTKLNKDETFSFEYKQNYLEFDVKTFDENGNAQYKNFKIDGTTSLNNLFSTINKANAGINLFYDGGTDKVVAMRTETGNFNNAGEEMEFVNVTRDSNGKVTEKAGSDRLNQFFNVVLGLSNETETGGTDARFTINGLETTRKSNTFTMNDVTFTLNKNTVTGKNPDYPDNSSSEWLYSNEASSVNIKTDTDEIVKNIKDFVEKYNEMIGKINGKLTEERYRTFTPLSDEQKVSMKEKEIEQWEEKAKSGMLRRDTLLTSGLAKMRMDLYAEVVSNNATRTDNNYNQLSEIGITTTKDYLERGKLEINEDKLRAAIEANPEAVYQLFMADGTSELNPNDKNTAPVLGIARRIRNTIAETMQKVEEKAGNTFKTEHNYSMGKDLLRIKDNITRLEDRLKQREQRYWNQYNAMEKAMQQLNNQSSQLLAQLGMGMQK